MLQNIRGCFWGGLRLIDHQILDVPAMLRLGDEDNTMPSPDLDTPPPFILLHGPFCAEWISAANFGKNIHGSLCPDLSQAKFR